MDTYDAVVVGGGPAGLQAALTLGRMHRSTLLLDSGEYRNAPVEHLQNFLTHDGRAPADFRAAARADLAAYSSVTVREARAGSATEEDGLFRVALEDGTSISGRTLLLATGVRDTLPDKPGLGELFGTVAAHCPFCHGHELAGTHVAVLGNGPHAARLPLLLAPIADRVTVLADGGPIDPAAGDLLARAGVTVRPEPVTGFRRSAGGATVSFASGPDELGRTSRPGVYAAGDLAHLAALPMPMPSVLTSAAAGLVAASSAVQALVVEDWGLAG
ncbi:NAD(P)/FAD-dependent oxidoreductase [Nocardioides dongkuii]|uniref:NAD(P)/FAD-dependent oxidoreductase n=1 Tax=Nocardioides dongkuii TaxID=2760089 RepID=UPI0015FE48E3|nr:NAD(P)/FAD-dependent oxidoreductase [Nocardioides dongkuii]